MNRREWHTLGRAKLGWGTGPWQEEPDAVAWVDEHTGLQCVARRHGRHGHWCGYVGLPPYHIWYRTSYDDISGVVVHGGLSWSTTGIPEFPEPAALDDGLWWLGFALNDAGDVQPGIEARYRNAEANIGIPHSYKPLDYAMEQCTALAAQLAEVSHGA